MFLRTRLVVLLIIAPFCHIYAQNISSGPVPNSFPGLSKQQADSVKNAIISSVFENPALYNDIYAKFLKNTAADSGRLFTFVRDLNLKFKTFQAQNQQAALGFAYNYNNSWTKNTRNAVSTVYQTYALNLSGNVAFDKKYNTTNLLESAFQYNASWMWGGKVKPLDPAGKVRFLQLQQGIISANISGNRALLAKLYAQRGALTRTTNQYYLGLNGNFSMENTQDFARRQFVPGVLINVGAKPWDSQQPLLYFNLPDYPFALLRLLTGTDSTFKLSPASFPTALVGIDHVIPDQDSVRRAVAGNLNPYNRFRAEISFKTLVATIANQMIFYSADFRYYREINPPAAINRAGLGHFTYFSSVLEATNGFFISYTAGRLPFDMRNNQVYALGFHFYLGN